MKKKKTETEKTPTPPQGSMWEILIGPAYQEGWERAEEPRSTSHLCRHCQSLASAEWNLQKKVFAFGNLTYHYATVYECLSCGNETWKSHSPKKPRVKKPNPEETVRLKQWKSLSPKVRDFLLQQFIKKGD